VRVKEWAGYCERCCKGTNTHTMSMYSTDLICLECKSEERQRPDYKVAVDADVAAIKSGNFNFEGIGE